MNKIIPKLVYSKSRSIPYQDGRLSKLFDTLSSHQLPTPIDAFHTFATLHPATISCALSKAKLEYCFSCPQSANMKIIEVEIVTSASVFTLFVFTHSMILSLSGSISLISSSLRIAFIDRVEFCGLVAKLYPC